ncbi:hypothetical protein CRG98_028573 [Punica granatum]|uniref:Uncharacterized protein n=1 Tax=Punica granatum TaxID=22663 RepID=A0A2I0J498_PUNGR|nr:hypothetical protein CRG98_028573 [Punica granatum]
MLPVDGLISGSRDRSCSRYAENLQGMHHTIKPPTSKEGQTMGDYYQSPRITQSKPKAKRTISHGALRDSYILVSGPSRFKFPFRVHPGLKFLFGSIPARCPDTSKQGTSSHGGTVLEQSTDLKGDASYNLWLHPLIEHATKEGQALSTPFWPTSSRREDSLSKFGSLFMIGKPEANMRAQSHELRERSMVH